MPPADHFCPRAQRGHSAPDSLSTTTGQKISRLALPSECRVPVKLSHTGVVSKFCIQPHNLPLCSPAQILRRDIPDDCRATRSTRRTRMMRRPREPRGEFERGFETGERIADHISAATRSVENPGALHEVRGSPFGLQEYQGRFGTPSGVCRTHSDAFWSVGGTSGRSDEKCYS